jgi:hypothetical protein
MVRVRLWTSFGPALRSALAAGLNQSDSYPDYYPRAINTNCIRVCSGQPGRPK